jgi:2-hydroxy-3-keto-5-methylthiopentenyl-1-phosphate phosphatase
MGEVPTEDFEDKMSDRADLLILVDFDGTVTQNDVGALLFHTFAKEQHEKAVSLWLEGRISSRECLERLCRSAQATEPDVKEFVLSQKIDENFSGFVDLCKCRDFGLAILSDGLDYYIRLILNKFGLERLTFFSNVLKFREGKLAPEFPYFDRGCGKCGNCKRFHLKNLRGKDQKVVYIGDGLSDRCAVTEANVVFAKNDLSTFCQREGISHHRFRDFKDVSRILLKLLNDQGTVATDESRLPHPDGI